MPVPALTQFSPGIGVFTADNGNTWVQGGAVVADLRSFVGLSNMCVWLVGTTTPGDGGQGMFVWNSTATVADDNGVTTIAPNGLTVGRWLRESGNVLQVSSVPNIAALRALSTGASPVWVEGYFTSADGGEGMFTTGATAADNGGTIIVSQDGTYYRASSGETLTIEWFGGSGNGSTDNLAAWNAMASAVAAQDNGGIIRFPPGGKYLFSANALFSFPASRVFELEIEGGGAIAYWPNAAGGFTFDFALPGHNLLLHGLQITTGQAGGGNGVLLSQSQPLQSFFNSSFRDVIFRGDDNIGNAGSDYWTTAANVSNTSGTIWDGCTFYGGGLTGTLLTFSGTGVGGTGGTNYSIFHNIVGCIFQSADFCIVYGAYAQGVTISQSNFQNANHAVYVPPSALGLAQLQVINNQLSCNIAQVLIETAIPLVMIANNWITGFINTTAIGFSQASGAAITGNCFTIQSTTGTSAIAISSDVGGAPFPIAISGNAINGAGIGVLIPSTGQSIVVSGNSFAYCTTPIVDNGSNNRIESNYGVLPSVKTLTPGSSPWTYTAGTRPESVTIASTTNISSVTLAGGSTSFLPTIVAAGVPLTLALDPNMGVTITYSGSMNASSVVL